MTRVLAHALTLAAALTFAFASPSGGSGSIKTAAKQLVANVRTLADQAKNGMTLAAIHQGALDLQSDASDLIQQLSTEAAQCEVDLVIKLAAAGVGSHEVLTLLLADDPLDVLDGRMALSFAFLERVAQQLEDELAVSADVGAHLAAIVFGTNNTASISETADAVVTNTVSQAGADNNNAINKPTRTKRGSGWSAGWGGVTWSSSNGRHTFNAKPTFGSGGLGAQATYTFRF